MAAPAAQPDSAGEPTPQDITPQDITPKAFNSDDINSDDRIVEEPTADAFTLSHIAQRRPDLWDRIYAHPNTDPSWRQQIREHFESEGLALPEPPAKSADLGLKLSEKDAGAYLGKRFGGGKKPRERRLFRRARK